jgi:hypothetical protein
MGQAATMQDLAQLERHVALDEIHIANQRAVVARLEQEGSSETAFARKLLQQFEDRQLRHVEHRDRLREELDA